MEQMIAEKPFIRGSDSYVENERFFVPPAVARQLEKKKLARPFRGRASGTSGIFGKPGPSENKQAGPSANKLVSPAKTPDVETNTNPENPESSEKETNVSITHRCSRCGQTFPNLAVMRRHDCDKFYCSICGHETTNKGALGSHMRVHGYRRRK